MEAAAIALKKLDFVCVIVGKGNSKNELEQLSKNLGIEKNVIFTGFVSDEDLPFIYKLSNCFIISSIAELLSLVTLQAMASSLPVISVAAGALVELVREGVNGYLYQEGDVQSCAKYIETILSDNQLQHKMGEKSLEFIQQHDINNTLYLFEKLYQDRIGRLETA